MYILGIDIGTTKIAGVLLDREKNQIIKALSINSKAGLKSAEEWEKIQDPRIILETSLKIVNELKGISPEPVQSIGISSQMHGFLYVDKQGKSVSPLYTWQDSRGAIPLESGKSARDIISEKTGYSIFAGYALCTHYYNTRNSLVPEQAEKIVSIGTYLGMEMCGSSRATIDPSEAASFGLYDISTREFRLDALQTLWGNADFLPDRVPFYSPMGKDPEGVPVFQSLGDNQASFYGTMKDREETLLVNLGTGGQVSLLMQEIPSSLKGLEVRPYPDGNLVVGSTLAGGKSFDLLVDFFSQVLSYFGFNPSRKEMYRIIDSQRITPPPTPLKVLPYFNGTRENPEIRGAIENIDLDNLTPYNLMHGFAEAMVNELKSLLTRNGLDRDFYNKRIVGSGNGIRQNPLVRHLIEKLFESELIISDLQEEAACGCALYGWTGLEKMLESS